MSKSFSYEKSYYGFKLNCFSLDFMLASVVREAGWQVLFVTNDIY